MLRFWPTASLCIWLLSPRHYLLECWDNPVDRPSEGSRSENEQSPQDETNESVNAARFKVEDISA